MSLRSLESFSGPALPSFPEACAGHALAQTAFLHKGDHLVMSAAALVDEAGAEVDRGIVDDLGLLVGEQALVAAMGWDEALWFRHSTHVET